MAVGFSFNTRTLIPPIPLVSHGRISDQKGERWTEREEETWKLTKFKPCQACWVAHTYHLSTWDVEVIMSSRLA